MKTVQTSGLEIAIHILLVVFCLVILNLPGPDLRIGIFTTGNGSFIWPSIFGTVINAVLFYGNTDWLIPTFLRRKGLYVFLLISGFLMFTIVESFADYFFAQQRGIRVTGDGDKTEIFLLAAVVNALTVLASLAYRFTKDWFFHQQLQGKLAQEKLAAELAFLKSQVNPHFLFNTLNNLFSMAIQNNDQPTADGILKLAGLMRYMLHDSNAEVIPLSKELDYIRNYIALQRIRLMNQPEENIQLTVEGDAENVLIAPMLFIPFIENAFKHGVSMNQPSVISIQFLITPKAVHMMVQNRINRLKKDSEYEPSGIGLDNVKKRLALLYPAAHLLQIDDVGEQYTVDLTLNTRKK